ncbi:DUF2188 domain-containing protein [Pontibacillus salicampi]|uniref:DUF2188 domain-containing protein n=1 Tax=Pontibacillus salicampi TaxID=1449801 RepID=A0ABV6LPN6_9BACI
MKEYTVEPNKNTTGWFVKIEGVAPEDEYIDRDEAVAKAEEYAQNNKPSKVYIMDKFHNVEDERSFS